MPWKRTPNLTYLTPNNMTKFDLPNTITLLHCTKANSKIVWAFLVWFTERTEAMQRHEALFVLNRKSGGIYEASLYLQVISHHGLVSLCSKGFFLVGRPIVLVGGRALFAQGFTWRWSKWPYFAFLNFVTFLFVSVWSLSCLGCLFWFGCGKAKWSHSFFWWPPCWFCWDEGDQTWEKQPKYFVSQRIVQTNPSDFMLKKRADAKRWQR